MVDYFDRRYGGCADVSQYDNPGRGANMAWRYYVGGWGGALGDNDITRENFASRRDAMAQVLLESAWYRSQGKDEHEREKSDLSKLIKELQAADWIEKGNEVLAKIYTLANEQRAWLNPMLDDDD